MLRGYKALPTSLSLSTREFSYQPGMQSNGFASWRLLMEEHTTMIVGGAIVAKTCHDMSGRCMRSCCDLVSSMSIEQFEIKVCLHDMTKGNEVFWNMVDGLN